MATSNQSPATELETRNSTDSAPSPPPRLTPAQRALQEIHHDCEVDTDAYLEETVVPFGGE